VAYLEAVSRNKSTLSVSQKKNKNKLVLIQKFAKLLSPEADKKEQVSILFDELYEKRKYFKKYIHSRLNDELRGLIRIENWREIKKLYALWRILEVMGCSDQSLNQVSINIIYYVFCEILSFAHSFFSGIIQSIIQHSEEVPKVGKGVARSETYLSSTEEAQQSP
jgi:hypothetical protein